MYKEEVGGDVRVMTTMIRTLLLNNNGWIDILTNN